MSSTGVYVSRLFILRLSASPEPRFFQPLTFPDHFIVQVNPETDIALRILYPIIVYSLAEVSALLLLECPNYHPKF
jgi:hypothetical protein